jgi:hypothetical protein
MALCDKLNDLIAEAKANPKRNIFEVEDSLDMERYMSGIDEKPEVPAKAERQAFEIEEDLG